MVRQFIKPVLEASILVALLQSILSYGLLSYWQRDELSLLECSLNSFVTGLIFLLLCLFISIYFTKSYNKKSSKSGEKVINTFLFLVLILVLSLLFYIGFDYTIFYFDSTISRDISHTMVQIPGTDKYASKQDMLMLANYPLAFINWISNLVFGIIGILISYFIVRKVS